MRNGGGVTKFLSSPITGQQDRVNSMPFALYDPWDSDTEDTQAWGTVSHRPLPPALGYANPGVVIVRVHADPTGWAGRAILKLNQLSQLPDNWDSYGAKSIERNSALMALSLIRAIHNPRTPEPSIVPLASGGIQFEWHTSQKDLEVALSPNGQASVYFEQIGISPTNSEGKISDLLGQIQSLVRSLG